MNLYVNTPFEWCQRCKAFEIYEDILRGAISGEIYSKSFTCEHLEICTQANSARMEWEEENE